MENMLVVVIEMMLIVLAAVAFYTCSDVVKLGVHKVFLHFAKDLAERSDCVKQGFGAILVLFGWIPVAFGWNHHGEKNHSCARDLGMLGAAYDLCPVTNIHGEVDALVKGLHVIHRIAVIVHYVLLTLVSIDTIENWIIRNHSTLYVASAHSKERGISESFNPCHSCAQFMRWIGFKNVVGHNKQLEVSFWNGERSYGNQEIAPLPSRYSL